MRYRHQANSIIEKIFKKAWAKIEVEIKVMEIAQIEEQVQTEVALMMQKGGDDWRSHVQGGVIDGIESPDAAEQLQDEVATRQEPVIPRNGRRASSDLDEEYGPEDLANIMPPEDPLHALVAAQAQPRQHHSGAAADDGTASLPLLCAMWCFTLTMHPASDFLSSLAISNASFLVISQKLTILTFVPALVHPAYAPRH